MRVRRPVAASLGGHLLAWILGDRRRTAVTAGILFSASLLTAASPWPVTTVAAAVMLAMSMTMITAGFGELMEQTSGAAAARRGMRVILFIAYGWWIWLFFLGGWARLHG